jgi:hypothetical protein
LRILLTQLLLLLACNGYSQLNGIYTIGGINPDFNTLTEAGDSMMHGGMTGNVIFNIRPGIYYDSIFFFNPTYPITIQAENLDSSSVILFPCSTCQSIFYYPKWLTFNHLTIYGITDVPIKTAQNITIRSCILFHQSQGRLNLSFSTTDTIEKSTIVSDISSLTSIGPLCIINSNITGEIRAQELDILNSSIVGNINYNNSSNSVSINNSTINGNTNGWKLHIQNTSIAGNINYNIGTTDTLSIINSTLTGNINGRKLHVQNTSIAGNINCGLISNIDNSEITGTFYQHSGTCIFKNNLVTNLNPSVSAIYLGTTLLQFYGNTLQCRVRFQGGNNHRIIGNTFYKYLEFSSSHNCRLSNNFICDTLTVIYCNSFNLLNNNFASSPNCFLSISSANCRVRNNIMPLQFILEDDRAIVENNNYPFGGGRYDIRPWHFNPEYYDSTDLHIRNPLLTGKGIPSNFIFYDIDSTYRPSTPSIGADEICIGTDTLNLQCGDSAALSLCNLPLTGTFNWQPSVGLNDPSKRNPVVAAITDSWYYATETSSGQTDSVFIHVIPFSVKACPSLKIACGDSVMLSGSSHANATYQWQPSATIFNPNSNFTLANPGQNTTYTVTASVNGCGVSTDSFQVTIDTLPVARFSYQATGLTVDFINNSSCANTYVWYFGDGDSSTQASPVHTFSQCNTWLVKLFSCNNSVCDSSFQYVFACNVGLQESSVIPLNPYPNPASQSINPGISCPTTSTFEISNSLQQVVLKGELATSSIDLNNLENGFYILRITCSEKIFQGKIIVRK